MNIRTHNRKINTDLLIHALRIVVGVFLSVVIADALNINFAPSTAIVTLLGIQATKRETAKTALKRIVSFIITIIISFGVHKLCGSELLAFLLSVAIIVTLTELAGWEGTVSINIVVIVHLFLQGLPFTTELLINETLRVFIGVIIAIIANIGIPDREDEFREYMKEIEATFNSILLLTAKSLKNKCGFDELNLKVDELSKIIVDADKLANQYALNNFSTHSDYYIKYIHMRKSELELLKIITDSTKLSVIRENGADLVSDYMIYISSHVGVDSPIKENEQMIVDLHKNLNELPLPTSRQEFDSQSALIKISDDLYEMVLVKTRFITSLSENQIKRYWH